MIDDAVNIRGLKRYAVDHAGYVPHPACAAATGKTVAIVGGGPERSFRGVLPRADGPQGHGV